MYAVYVEDMQSYIPGICAINTATGVDKTRTQFLQLYTNTILLCRHKQCTRVSISQILAKI